MRPLLDEKPGSNPCAGDASKDESETGVSAPGSHHTQGEDFSQGLGEGDEKRRVSYQLAGVLLRGVFADRCTVYTSTI